MAAVIGAWSRLTPRPSSSISFVFFVLGEVTPSWSSLTKGSADDGLRLASFWVELGLGRGKEPVLEVSGSDGIFSLGRGAEEVSDDCEGLLRDVGLLVGSLFRELDTSAELRLGLRWLSVDDLFLEEDNGL